MSKNKQDNRQLLQDSFQIRFQKTESRDGKLVARGEFARAGIPTANKRIYPESVWRKNLLKLEQDIIDRKVLGELDHPCLTDINFKVLCEDGWKSFIDIRVGDRVWSRVNNQAILSTVHDIINHEYEGIAYKVKGRSIDSGFSPNHRFLLEKRPDSNKSEEFYNTIETIFEKQGSYSHCAIPKTANWNLESSSSFVIPGVEDIKNTKLDVSQDLVLDAKIFSAFMGIYLSEGYVRHTSDSGYQIYIFQSNEWSRKLIWDEILKKMPELPWREDSRGFIVNDARLCLFLEKLGDQYNRYIPKSIKNLNDDCLRELLFWFSIGDGRIISSSKRNEDKTFKEENFKDFRNGNAVVNTRQDVFSVSEQLVRDLHECLVKTGRCGSFSVIYPDKDYEFAGRLIKAENKQPLYQLHFSNSKNIWLDPRFLKIEKFNHVGNIYCLSVTHGNFYMEQNGKSFWTGNCDGKTKLQRVSHLITDLSLNPDGTIIGEFEVIEDTPNGKTLKALADANVTIGVSSRGYGSVKMNESGHDVVQDDYVLMTFDAVSDPANSTSWPEFSREGSNEESKQVPESKTINEAEPKVNKQQIVEEPEKKENSVESPKSKAEAELNVAPVKDPYAKPEFVAQFYGVYSNQDDAWAATTPEKIFPNKEEAQAFADRLNGEDKEPAQKARYIVKPMDVAALAKYTNESVELVRTLLQSKASAINESKSIKEDNDDRLAEICAENAQLTLACKDLGFGLFLYKSLGHHPKCKDIIAGLGNLQRYESIEQLKGLIKVHVEDADNFKRIEKASIQTSMLKFEKEIDSLKEEIKSVSEGKQSMIDKITQEKEQRVSELSKEINSLREENKEMKARLFLESRLTGNPNAILIRKAWESNKVLTEDKISVFVESMTRPIESKPLFESVRESLKRRLPGNKINNMVEESIQGTTLSDAMKSNRLTEQRIDPSVGISIDEYKKLSGVR